MTITLIVDPDDDDGWHGFEIFEVMAWSEHELSSSVTTATVTGMTVDPGHSWDRVFGMHTCAGSSLDADNQGQCMSFTSTSSGSLWPTWPTIEFDLPVNSMVTMVFVACDSQSLYWDAWDEYDWWCNIDYIYPAVLD